MHPLLKTQHVITGNLHMQRLDFALAQLTDLSRHHIAILIKTGFIKLLGNTDRSITYPTKTLKASYKVQEGQIFEVQLEAYQTKALKQQGIKDLNTLPSLEVLFEDENILIINKPVGLLVHPNYTPNALVQNQEITLCDLLQAHFSEKGLQTFSQKAGIVHRLDKETSGVMIIAKTDQAHHNLQLQFANRKIRKIYLAKTENWNHIPQEMCLECQIGPSSQHRYLMQAYNQTILPHLSQEHMLYQDTLTPIPSKHQKQDLQHLETQLHTNTPIIQKTSHEQKQEEQKST